jgi:hypothetical protein
MAAQSTPEDAIAFASKAAGLDPTTLATVRSAAAAAQRATDAEAVARQELAMA